MCTCAGAFLEGRVYARRRIFARFAKEKCEIRPSIILFALRIDAFSNMHIISELIVFLYHVYNQPFECMHTHMRASTVRMCVSFLLPEDVFVFIRCAIFFNPFRATRSFPLLASMLYTFCHSLATNTATLEVLVH